MSVTAPVGLLIGSHIPPAEIAGLSTLAENVGFTELWLAEDLWYTSGVVCAGVALAATRSIPVGVGIQSAVTRHTSIQALDFATLCHAYPGRFLPGIGLGLPSWLDQMGLRPKAGLRAVREAVQNVSRLLAGETVTDEGTQKLDGITLAYPLAEPPPIYVGAVGPASVRQTGRIAGGLVASVTAGTRYVEWARELLDEGAAGTGARPRMVTFALFGVDDDGERAHREMRSTLAFYLTAMQGTELLSVYGIAEEVATLAALGPERMAGELPDRWITDLTVCGTPARCAARVEELLAAGSDSVILFPVPAGRSRELIERAGRDVLPLVAPR